MLDDALRAIHSLLGVHGTVSPERSRINVPINNPDRVTELLVVLREAGIRLTEFSLQKPTLDEVFLTLTGHGVAEDAATNDTTTERISA